MSDSNRSFQQNTIAMVYDFDGTLCPQPMQDYTVLPSLGINAEAFWHEVATETMSSGEERMLVYMRLLLERAQQAGVKITRRELARMASQIRYYPGVSSWFERINRYVREQGKGKVKVRHYIVSAGLKEILDGCTLRKEFAQIYASQYHFDERGRATFPGRVVTDTTKTQYLFRINKGREDTRDTINDHMEEVRRPVPFENIIYIGDAMADVPSMAVARSNGGHTIAVHNDHREGSEKICRTLLEDGRVDFIAPADYRQRAALSRRVKLLLDSVIAQIAYRRELFQSKEQYEIDD
jgi:hypothetical protein